jgi:Tol biopolymer transport system component
MKACLARLALLTLAVGGLGPGALAQAPTKLTANLGQDTAPAWDPAGETIVYMRSKNPPPGGGVPFDIYRVQSNGTGEGALAVGPSNPWGVANSLSWVGTTRILLTEERNIFHEYMAVNSASPLIPFTRTVNDGNDAVFTRKLLIPGGGGGGVIRASRNGSKVLWRHSDNGGSGTTTLRVASYSALAGQNANGTGTLLYSVFTTTSQPQALLDGFALTPDGSQFVISLPSGAGKDLFLYSTAGFNQRIRQLTTSGQALGRINGGPDVSANGKIVFHHFAPGGFADLYIVNLDGSGLTNVTNTPTISEASPSWSPEGMRVAFSRGGDIWMMGVPAANVPPIADAGPDQNVDEGALVTLDGSASSDAEGHALTYVWTQTAGPAVTLSDSSAHPTFTAPATGSPGDVLVFELVVNDGIGDSAADTVHIHVNNVNQLPVADAGPDQTVDEGALVTLDGSGSFDPDGGSLTYQWMQTAGPTVALSDASSTSPTFTAPAVPGNAAPVVLEFALTVADECECSLTDTVTVTVNNINLAPTAYAGDDQAVSEGEIVTLQGSASDPDGDALTLRWAQVAGNPVNLSDPAGATPSFTAPPVATNGSNEILTFRLVANDGRVDSAAVSVNVTVRNLNQPPVAEAIAPETVQEGSAVALNGATSYDPDSDPLTYSWTQTGGPSVVLSDATSLAPSFTAPTVGATGTVLSFELVVNDGQLDSVPDRVDVMVTNVNQAPSAHAGANQTRNEGTLVVLEGGLSADPDGDALGYQWTQSGGSPVDLSGADSMSASFTAPQVDETTVLTFELVVSDGQLASAPASTTVTILNVNSPVACQAASASITAPWPPNHRMAPLDVLGVTDPDNDQVTITITGVTQDEPVTSAEDATSPDAVIQGSQALVRVERYGSNGRVYQVRFRADDGRGGSCSGSVFVGVPKSMKPGSTAVDDGQNYDSTGS